MVISSLVVEAYPADAQRIAARLVETPGVEVCGVDAATGAIAVVLEAAGIDASHDTASGFAALPGVRGVNLVYADFEDENLPAPSAPGPAR